MPPMDSSGWLKRSNVDGDLLQPDDREIGREHKGLANSMHEGVSGDDSVGLSIDERNQRKLKGVVIYSEDEDENYIDVDKPSIEPEPEIQCSKVAWVNVDDDLIGEIICKASWREISVLRCVSKQFADLVNSADFLRQLLKKCNKEPDVLAGIFYHDYSDNVRCIINGRRIVFQVKFVPTSKWYNILHENELENRGLKALNMQILPQNFHIQECRHGLLLCTRITDYSPRNIAQGENHQIDEYYVCNPITRKNSWLPMPPKSLPKYSRTAFLVDKGTGNYQVVKMPLTSDLVGKECCTEVHVYSSLLRCWRTHKYRYQCSKSRGTISIFDVYLIERPTVQIGHSLYWIDRHLEIVCCDTEKETVEFIEHPNYRQSFYSVCLGEYQGMLHYVSHCRDDRINLLWRLEQGQWKVVKEIPHVELKLALASNDMGNFAFHALDQERIFLSTSRELVCYNFMRNTVEMHVMFAADDMGRKAALPYLLPKLPLPLF